MYNEVSSMVSFRFPPRAAADLLWSDPGNGLIFCSDATDYIDDLKKIKDKSSAFRVLRQLVTKNVNAAVDWAKRLISSANTADKGERLEAEVGISAELGVMGGL